MPRSIISLLSAVHIIFTSLFLSALVISPARSLALHVLDPWQTPPLLRASNFLVTQLYFCGSAYNEGLLASLMVQLTCSVVLEIGRGPWIYIVYVGNLLCACSSYSLIDSTPICCLTKKRNLGAGHSYPAAILKNLRGLEKNLTVVDFYFSIRWRNLCKNTSF